MRSTHDLPTALDLMLPLSAAPKEFTPTGPLDMDELGLRLQLPLIGAGYPATGGTIRHSLRPGSRRRAMNGARAEMRAWMRLFVALGEQALSVQALAARLGTTEGRVSTMLLAGSARGMLETETLWRLARPELATGAALYVALGDEVLPAKVLGARLGTTEGLVMAMLLDASACGALETATAWRLAWPQWAAAAQTALAAQDGDAQPSR